MVDRLFADAGLAALYDPMNPSDQRADYGFYLPLVMAAPSVLDVGCGTGSLLRLARQAGHDGQLCGVDPAVGMLEQARAHTGIEWILGDVGSVGPDRMFDLVVMAGHAFQVYVRDDELRTALATIRSVLADGGRFAFETRNPLARAWEDWTPDRSVEAVDDDGRLVRMVREVEMPVTGDTASFSHTFTGPGRTRPRISRSTLRFLGADALSSFLSDAGLVIEEQYGDWDRSPLTGASPEIITIARSA
ncbi:trans-aconitate 2-methyltransferase [Streptomyces sp. NBC_01669]|uniref:class I SAM-dependent methyltransferase n=1 Tax=Streptomyces sp. NBC_01669 TaxID=2975909 RepID=UPI0022583032|nr:class I SAM-dependent methyltransferase [Streptomyces sp. NBC_01669]MCX4533370.1 methyltransferase domain-containing protein [Streptomyces sp. NBC_01669]